jgi:hypothetical protein
MFHRQFGQDGGNGGVARGSSSWLAKADHDDFL